jgi:hypothetical protein
LVGSVICTLVAVTVPVVSALPCAVTHLPTTTECDVVVELVVIFVLDPTVIFFVVVLLAPDCRCCEAITNVEPETELTFPSANAAVLLRPAAPDGLLDGKLDGRLDGKPDGRCPVGRWPPPKPRAPQEPFTGELTTNVLAVKDDADDDVPDAALARTQSPAFAAASVVVTVWLNLVEVVQVTATCPFCWLCTCIVVPVIAATSPDAAGPNWPVLALPVRDGAEDGVALGPAVEAPLREDPHPPRASAAIIPMAATASRREVIGWGISSPRWY